MTLGFALFAVGLALVASALKDKSVADIFKGVTGPDVPFGNPKDYATDIAGNKVTPGDDAKDALNPNADSPLKKLGNLIGFPFTGTHTIGNWQSDRAVDIATPVGTPVYATVDGTITRAGRLAGVSQSAGDRFAGFRVQIADEAWYGHLSRIVVRQGQKVKAGQLIGYSGSANGVEHLHYARRTGDLPK